MSTPTPSEASETTSPLPSPTPASPTPPPAAGAATTIARPHFIWRFGYRGCAIFLGLIFFTGGMSKLMPFPGVMGPVWLEDRLEPYGLALFARFIAWSEAGIGLLVLSGRFTTLGAIMLVPMIVNIFFVVTSMGWRGTPFVVWGFLVMNAYLLWFDRARIKLLFIDDAATIARTPTTRRDPPGDYLSIIGMALCLAGPILFAIQPHTGVAVVIVGLVLMLSVARRRRVATELKQR